MYTASTNNEKKKKTDVYITSEDNDTYYVYFKPDVSSSKPSEESLKSNKLNKIFAKPNNRTVTIGNVFGAQYKEKNISKMH